MKKMITVFVLSGLGLLSAGALQAEGLGVFGSLWDPSDGDETFGAGVRARGGDGPIYFEVRGTYFEDITDDRGLISNDLQVIPVDLGLGLQMLPNESIEIYAGGGATYYFMDSEYGNVDDEVGYYLQVGTELGVSEGLGLFAEAVWRHVEGSVEDGGQLEDSNIDLKGMAVNFGLVLNW
jgi:hypothetical protein